MVRQKDYSSFLIPFAIALSITCLVFLFLLPSKTIAPTTQPKISPSPTISVPQRATLQGKVICLPHRDTSGPQTRECMQGLQTDQGNYGLDTSLMSQIPPQFSNGDRISANGVLTPIENLSSDHWQKYDIKGIFSATDSLQVL